MNVPELMAVGIAGIFILITIVRQAVSIPSKYIPLISLFLGIGLAVYVGLTKQVDVIELILTALLPALGASGVHSTYNTYKHPERSTLQ